jgi:multicomponent K+:H+ antiporter subunit A
VYFRFVLDEKGDVVEENPEQQSRADEHDGTPPDARDGDAFSGPALVPGLIMRLVSPAIVTVAVYLFIRGHNLPGGGFVAGITMSVAVILQYIAGGTRWVETRLAVRPLNWIGLGLLFAALTGCAAWLFGFPFLTSYFTYADAPVIGKVPLASAVVFDLGVFLLVVGATILILIALAHQSIRTHRPARTEAPPEPRPAPALAGQS